MKKEKALEIIKYALQGVDDGQLPQIIHSSVYHSAIYDALITLYDQDGYRHMPDIILENIAVDCGSIYSIAICTKKFASECTL